MRLRAALHLYSIVVHIYVERNTKFASMALSLLDRNFPNFTKEFFDLVMEWRAHFTP